MTINREHLAGLLLVQQQVSITNPLAAEQLEYLIAQAQAAPEAEPVALSVWYGPMPESNGKSNYTAILHRRGECMSEGITIDRGEYPDRVRYEADCMRFLIGELADEPDILDYDAEAHSGYTAPQHDAELVELLDDLASALECEVNARYAGSQTHPALARKYEGDMDEVRRARAKLATLRHV